VTIPLRGWLLDADKFRTRAVNFFDHNNVGDSDIFSPLTIQQALIRGWELTLRSPLAICERSPRLLESSRAGTFANHGRPHKFRPAGRLFPS
jgi:hypothetical protein